ncbi:hypothetical protein SKAU_G00147410 [Synaphobranchus kaupii]|uniref:Uncharacterized protein n=1 Tax=Synaphobranchus kaupii TaxID=118154 RepID=A0A9Q1FUE6_SYNKA|nr:hypothetical protein SKAU_G00147410 [Synaphobranchus kaupii]
MLRARRRGVTLSPHSKGNQFLPTARRGIRPPHPPLPPPGPPAPRPPGPPRIPGQTTRADLFTVSFIKEADIQTRGPQDMAVRQTPSAAGPCQSPAGEAHAEPCLCPVWARTDARRRTRPAAFVFCTNECVRGKAAQVQTLTRASAAAQHRSIARE